MAHQAPYDQRPLSLIPGFDTVRNVDDGRCLPQLQVFLDHMKRFADNDPDPERFASIYNQVRLLLLMPGIGFQQICKLIMEGKFGPKINEIPRNVADAIGYLYFDFPYDINVRRAVDDFVYEVWVPDFEDEEEDDEEEDGDNEEE